MLTKANINIIRSLNRKSKREEHGLFVVEGVKNVNELINSDIKIDTIFALEGTEINSDFTCISAKELERISFLKHPNQVLALAKIPNSVEINLNKTMLILDDIKDPGNLGTIIRTADWFGIDQIVCSHESVDLYNPKVVMSTMGSILRVKVNYQDLEAFVPKLNIPIYGALLDGESIYNTNFEKESALFLGSESHGISKKLIPLVTHKTTIPGSGNAESLNLAIATGIFCSSYFSQHK